jgi:hypothetical protein
MLGTMVISKCVPKQKKLTVFQVSFCTQSGNRTRTPLTGTGF